MNGNSNEILMAALLLTGSAVAQDYPSRPIRMIVPTTAGGSVDMLARTVGPRLNERWGQQVVIDNRSGAGGVIAAELTAKAPADGYTLILTTPNHTINAAFRSPCRTTSCAISRRLRRSSQHHTARESRIRREISIGANLARESEARADYPRPARHAATYRPNC
jgi:hypothetical protein